MSPTDPSGPPVARRLRALLAVAAAGLALGAGPTGAASAAPGERATPRIVGGTKTTAASAPYQAHLRVRWDGKPWDDPSASQMGFCGGVVISPTVVITAAHCVIHAQQKVPGRAYMVETGYSKYNPNTGEPAPFDGDTLQKRRVTNVRVHRSYPNPAAELATRDQRSDDVATLTLASPLSFDANTAPIPLAGPGPASASGVARATGFGTQSETGDPNGRLWSLDANLYDPGDPTYGPGDTSALYVVAIAPQGSVCFGDSGGPLVQDGRLLGLASGVDGCGPGRASFFTSVAAPEIRDFILGNNAPPPAPRGGRDVSISGYAQAGRQLGCFPGTWTNAPSLTVTFVDTRGGAVLQSGASTTYAVGDGDVGRTIACRATATTAGGTGLTPQSGVTPPIVARPPTPGGGGGGGGIGGSTGAAPPALRVRTAAGSSRVRRRGRVAFVIAVDNVGGAAAADVRTCVTIGSRFTLSSRSGGKVRRGRLCWRTKTLKRRTLKRFVLRAKSNAKRGRVIAIEVSARATGVTTDRTRERLTVRR